MSQQEETNREVEIAYNKWRNDPKFYDKIEEMKQQVKDPEMFELLLQCGFSKGCSEGGYMLKRSIFGG